MNVVCVQFDIAWEDKPANFATVRRLLGAITIPPGALVVLPEMFATGFSMNVAGIAEGPGGSTEAFLAETGGTWGAFVLGGVVTRADDGRGLNQALLVGPDGKTIGRYTKMHPFSFAGEDRYYAGGDQPVAVEMGGTRLAPFICYDLRFPEVFRSAAAGGAEVLAVIANWPAGRQEHWRTLLRARAIENQAWVIGVNRVGADPNAAYAGGSLVVDPWGTITADAGTGQCAMPAELDLPALRRYRQEFPVLRDMKPGGTRAGGE
jgi:predicted amidohydrolase